MLDSNSLAHVIALAPAAPALGAVIIALLLAARLASERVVATVAQTAIGLGFLGLLVGLVGWAAGPAGPLELGFGSWYSGAGYDFRIDLLIDGRSAAVSALVSLLLAATSQFSIAYLHREPGFNRFFLLMLLFGAGMQALVLAGNLELLFVGWEIVGMTSVLLVGFFHERLGPVKAATRVLVTYRLCDIGLLTAGVSLHRWLHTSDWMAAEQAALTSPWPSTFVGLSLVFAAMGKSAQFPLGGWLPRAMEGPTASSAVFYGSLSVHAGVYLLLRAAPLLEHSLAAQTMMIAVGAITAVISAMSSQASPDAKSALSYATASQVGLMFVEIGFGLYTLATIHLVAHAVLRYYQFLRTPSALQDALARRAALGRTEADEGAVRWEALGLRTRRYVYRMAIERFDVEIALERYVVRPVMALSRRLDRLESQLLALHGESERRARDSTGGRR
ncbi:proton-conducting transporter membrane subunit [Nannocystis sp. ILAH1]|uniref:proton-conducting transporter transmembrane domain-containing protein n=1 Tax=Nannocystis sp. ILAH1 TaxID=2996789 RepID=UPI00226EA678|nr:proton-conducting transporter membrane subunit [Nannocystis sp. ILAH1]MCY0993267.1 proton-conducting transporter membrane subunit [Nannocystis sp. ILAH1]